jgi:hypothetical protein
LVANANALYLRGRNLRLLQHLLHDNFLRLPNFKRVVLNPSWLRKILGELLLSDGTGWPLRLNNTALELVVPWSSARMYFMVGRLTESGAPKKRQ